jgi:glycosyltransferase involved in cell wall biosynthesis
MGDRDLVSVIIPTWNRLALVQRAIGSVVAQSHHHWQLIVVDDGSTDGTVEELRKLADSRIEVIAAPHSGSTAISRNRGIEAAKGEWIAFLDSDDLWFPRKLELQLQALATSGAGWCYTDYQIIDEADLALPERGSGFRALNGQIIEPLLLGRTAAFVGTLLIRSEVIVRVGPFDTDLRFREDLDFEFRLALAADAVAVPEVLAGVRSHGSRKTAAAQFPFERTAEVYRNFLKRRPERRLARAARAMLASHLADGGARRLAAGHIRVGLKLATQSLLLCDRPGHWLRAAARGLRGLMTR